MAKQTHSSHSKYCDVFYTCSCHCHSWFCFCAGSLTVPGNCRDPRTALPLLTAYSVAGGDHFYTTSVTEHQHAIAEVGYTDQVGTSRYIFSSQEPHTVPLYRMFSASITDHFYTIDEVECVFAIRGLGYADEVIAEYVYADAACAAIPVYHL
ncbi:uncharacterized protein LACBIDRAFT_300174 [Laccaria bicolor S238N-H82]|uniref:Predicted protein n=1 Tax=Laccaria bicolor (strain S238N-H82 / ATCC MYA-4686) TaxID=486041 RepID=B0DG72_LACBS|nr:uncharacterized protein LACBIDRAFT_300174 [Laccaria bicolor S238N-H82]EDR06463.1 predicted protein [Laccaria bicolor S238N-H82]|eukprot:XP_001882835.1 predicted protein [Laccaria bicolor S238N-H82]